MRYFYLIIIFSFLMTSIDVKAGWFDPTVSGCAIENETSKKIHCVSIKFNESNDPGSLKRAERECLRILNYYGKKYSQYGYWIGGSGCLSSGGPFR